MQTITVNGDFGAKLGNTTGEIAICDEAGRVLGFFSPRPDKPKLDDLQLEAPLQLEVIREQRKNGITGKPLEEILKRLGL